MIKLTSFFKIIILLLLILSIVNACTIAYASYPEKIDSTTSDQQTSVINVSSIILGAFQVAGYSIAAVMAAWMGFKYITSSPDGKAEIKGQAVAFLIGAVLLFAASTIVGWLKNTVPIPSA